MVFDPTRPFGAPFLPSQEPLRDPIDAKAVAVVKAWVGNMMRGLVIDEHDAPLVQMNANNCAGLAVLIAEALHEAAEGRLGR